MSRVYDNRDLKYFKPAFSQGQGWIGSGIHSVSAVFS